MYQLAEPTTDLDAIRNGNAFTWGKVVRVHEIGRYAIVEYLERKMNSRELSGHTLFHVYIDGKDRSRSCSSMEGAIVTAISYAAGYERTSTSGAYFICKMLGIEE